MTSVSFRAPTSWNVYGALEIFLGLRVEARAAVVGGERWKMYRTRHPTHGGNGWPRDCCSLSAAPTVLLAKSTLCHETNTFQHRVHCAEPRDAYNSEHPQYGLSDGRTVRRGYDADSGYGAEYRLRRRHKDQYCLSSLEPTVTNLRRRDFKLLQNNRHVPLQTPVR